MENNSKPLGKYALAERRASDRTLKLTIHIAGICAGFFKSNFGINCRPVARRTKMD